MTIRSGNHLIYTTGILGQLNWSIRGTAYKLTCIVLTQQLYSDQIASY